VQHNAGGTTSKKRGEGATLYPILHMSQYHVTGEHTGNQANKQANKQIILGKTLQGVEGYIDAVICSPCKERNTTPTISLALKIHSLASREWSYFQKAKSTLYRVDNGSPAPPLHWKVSYFTGFQYCNLHKLVLESKGVHYWSKTVAMNTIYLVACTSAISIAKIT
jgi:hypothetical protein